MLFINYLHVITYITIQRVWLNIKIHEIHCIDYKKFTAKVEIHCPYEIHAKHRNSPQKY